VLPLVSSVRALGVAIKQDWLALEG
jgi:hypothetical protein